MEGFWFPVQLSLLVATAATLITFVLALLAAYWIVTKNVKGKAVIETVFFLPLVLPPTVIGFILIIIFGNKSIVGKLIESLIGSSLLFTVPAAIIAGAVVAFPLMYQSLKTGFLSVDSNIIGAAKVDGATNLKLLVFIILPLSFKSIVTGVVLSFTRAFGEFGATLMFAGNIPGQTQTIPTAVYFALESGETKLAWYYVMISISFSFVLLLLINQTSKSK